MELIGEGIYLDRSRSCVFNNIISFWSYKRSILKVRKNWGEIYESKDSIRDSSIIRNRVGTYIYQNRYSFYRYLPAENENKLQSINFKLCDENGNLFSGRVKSGSDLYLNIYSYKDGELNGLNVIYYKDSIKELGHWKEGKQNGLFQLYTEDGILIESANFKNGERDGLTEQYFVPQEN